MKFCVIAVEATLVKRVGTLALGSLKIFIVCVKWTFYTSSVTKHVLSSDTALFDKVKVLGHDKNFISRELLEAIEINRYSNFNRD